MDADASPEWVRISVYENMPHCLRPSDVLRGWLRERGIDWMPLGDNDVIYGLACDRTPGHVRGWIDIKVRGEALRRLGLHPDQPTSPGP